VDNRIDPISRSVTVRAILANDDGLLKPGLLMEVQLLTRERDALLVPEAALFQQAKAHYVFVIVSGDPGFIVQKREVEIGSRWRGTVEILEGLNAGDQVVTEGMLKVKSGDQVRLLEQGIGSGEQ
jgi:membrane fusion protein (multidrug efflux system)